MQFKKQTDVDLIAENCFVHKLLEPVFQDHEFKRIEDIFYKIEKKNVLFFVEAFRRLMTERDYNWCLSSAWIHCEQPFYLSKKSFSRANNVAALLSLL